MMKYQTFFVSHKQCSYTFDYIRNITVQSVKLISDDEVTGGIPDVIFKLKSLQVLHLNNNAITMVPPAINNLQNLKELSLSHNPLLESLPGLLGHLPNIKGNQTTCICVINKCQG